MLLPELSPAGLRARARERSDMVGSTFVSEDEVGRYVEAAFQEWLGILGSGYDDLLLRNAKVTAFAGESRVQLGAQCPGTPTGWLVNQITRTTGTLVRPDGTPTCFSFQHTASNFPSMIVIPITNASFGTEEPSPITVEVYANAAAGYFGFDVATLARTPPSFNSPGAEYRAWVNAGTGAVATVDSAMNVTSVRIDSGDTFAHDQIWKRIRVTFVPLGPRMAFRMALNTADVSFTRDTSLVWDIASVNVFQSTPIKKLRGVRVVDGRFLRRRQLRDLENYLSGVSASQPDGYLLSSDNGRDGMPQLTLFPTPTVDTALQYYFVPMFSVADAAGLSMAAGWDEYVVLSAAIKMIGKEEGDPAMLFAERDLLLKRMKEDLEPLDVGEPAQVTRYNGATLDPYSLLNYEESF